MEADPRDERIRQLEATIEQLLERIRQLEARCEELERAAARQAAPFRRPEAKRKPPGTHRRAGRAIGHAAAWRARPEQIDEEIDAPLPRDPAGAACCPHCAGRVGDVRACEQFIEDLPPTRPHTTRLVTYSARCPRCRKRVRSTHPLQISGARGAASTHLGPRALALAAWLNKHLGLTMRGTCRVLERLAGLRITPGGLSQALDRVADKAAPLHAALQGELRAAPAAHSDETSWWVGGQLRWLWCFTTPRETLYRIQSGRGRAVVLDTLGPDFGGVLVSDCLSSYENLPYPMQKCYAHHLRAIAQARDRAPPEDHADFDQLSTLLKGAMLLRRMKPDMPPADYAARCAALERSADERLAPRGGPAAKVATRLRKRRTHLFTFLYHDQVEPTNNRAERALRPAVIARKLSCGNKTPRGVRTWEILASLAATTTQRGLDWVHYLQPSLCFAPAR